MHKTSGSSRVKENLQAMKNGRLVIGEVLDLVRTLYLGFPLVEGLMTYYHMIGLGLYLAYVALS